MVITNKNLYFLEWDTDANTYNVVKKLPISQIENVKATKFGFNHQLSIQSNGSNFDLFSYASSVGIDAEKNNQVLEYLKHIIKKSPVAPKRH